LWGYVKNIVYQVKISDFEHLKASIRGAVTTVTPNICRATKRAHIEIIDKIIYKEKV
jgi:hypothetical protein